MRGPILSISFRNTEDNLRDHVEKQKNASEYIKSLIKKDLDGHREDDLVARILDGVKKYLSTASPAAVHEVKEILNDLPKASIDDSKLGKLFDL